MSPDRRRKKIEKLRGKGKLAEALELQGQACAEEGAVLEEWQLLVELAQAMRRVDVEVVAQIGASRHSYVTAEVWLDLATRAEGTGLKEAALDARFRAADACAVIGDVRRAVSLCGQVLKQQPEHPAARRIRAILGSRLARLTEPIVEVARPAAEPAPPATAAPDGEREQARPPAKARTMSGAGETRHEPASGQSGPPAAGTREPGKAGVAAGELDRRPQPPASPGTEARPPEELPRGGGCGRRGEAPGEGQLTARSSKRTGGAAANPSPDTAPAEGPRRLPSGETTLLDNPDARLGSEQFVLSVQTWPSVLDMNCLMFIGSVVDIDQSLSDLCEPISVAPEATLYEQGKHCELLYCLEEGEVWVHRDRGVAQDFSTIPAGHFFGEAGTLTGMVASTTVQTVGRCQVRVLSRKTFQDCVKSRKSATGKVINALRNWYLEAAANLCPLLTHLSLEELQVHAESSGWAVFRAGEYLARQGREGVLYVVVMGIAQVVTSHGDAAYRLGYISTGDLAGEIEAVPSPVSITAEGTLFALPLDRRRFQPTTEEARAACEAWLSERDQVLEWVSTQNNGAPVHMRRAKAAPEESSPK